MVIFLAIINTISQTEALKWNNTDGALQVTGDIILPAGSNILIDGVPLKFDDFDSFPSASSNVKGMVKIFEGDFKFNDSNQLILAKQGSSKWGREGNKIWYPVGEHRNLHIVLVLVIFLKRCISPGC